MKLDKNRILDLLAEADTKWYNSHSDHSSHQYNYREHLDFVADYIARKYDKKSKRSGGINLKNSPGDNQNHNKRKKVQAERLL